MALVANPIPLQSYQLGTRVAYFDPTADMAGLKYGRVSKITRGASGTDKVLTIDVSPEAGGDDLTAQDPTYYRVVDVREDDVPAL